MATKQLSPEAVKAHTRRSWNAEARTYDSYGAANAIAAQRNARAWADWLRTTIGEGPLDVLDVGTGTGAIAVPLAEQGHRVTAIDQADEMLARTRAKAHARGVDIDIRAGDAERLDFPDASFDVVISRWVLWLLPDPAQAAQEWQRVLRPGGTLHAISSVSLASTIAPGGIIARSRRRSARIIGELMASVAERRIKWNPFDRTDLDLPLATFTPASIDANTAVFRNSGLAEITVRQLEEVNRISLANPKQLPLHYRLIAGPTNDHNDFYCISGQRPTDLQLNGTVRG